MSGEIMNGGIEDVRVEEAMDRGRVLMKGLGKTGRGLGKIGRG